MRGSAQIDRGKHRTCKDMNARSKVAVLPTSSDGDTSALCWFNATSDFSPPSLPSTAYTTIGAGTSALARTPMPAPLLACSHLSCVAVPLLSLA